MQLNFEELCQKVVVLAKEVGTFIKQEENKVQQQDIEQKALNSLVSYVDKAAEQIIVDGLQTLLPEAGFIAEENTIDKIGEQYTWIIDPLDGTTNFLHGVPTYSVSIALRKEEHIVLGVVFEINRNECFYAWKTGGAFLNGEKINVSNTTHLANSLIATGFPYYDFKRSTNYFLFLKQLAHSTRGIRRIGSAAVDLVYTACGRFDVFFEYSLQPWDVAAGAFIVQEAGGLISDFSGTANWLFGKEIIATNPFIKSDFQQLLTDYNLQLDNEAYE